MSDVAGVIVLVGRILVVIFPAYISGIAFHIRYPKMAEGYAKSMGFPVPAVTGLPAGLWLVASSLSIALGIWPDVGALMLGAFTIPTALYFHRYWVIEDTQQRQAQQQLFFRNLILLAACIVMFGFFTSVGKGLRFAVTAPLIDLS
jgi:putative oxidoreductase